MLGKITIMNMVSDGDKRAKGDSDAEKVGIYDAKTRRKWLMTKK